MSKMYINIVHRAENDLKLLESVKFQQEECHRLGLKTTLVIGYPAMLNPEITEYIKEEGEREDVEIGISFHDISCKELQAAAGSKEKALYLLSLEGKKMVIDMVFEKFMETFGFLPTSVTDYIMDANTLKYIKKKYPLVKAAITNCFEEGVKMFAGNCNSWVLFSDGGPWGAYYPSRDNHLIPARDEEDYVGIVGLPHLNRDMVLALTSRDDYFASHPINVMRAKANKGKESPYMYHFFDQWVRQTEYNGYGYYNVFVSAAWITEGYQTMFVDDYLDARQMYTDALDYYKKMSEEGKSECVTMTEFAQWYQENVEIGTPEVNLWNEILCGSKRQNFWYIDPNYRIAVDMNMGGTIIDLRPYSSHPDNNMGPDTKVLYNGSNPFIISGEHRNTEASCCLEYENKGISVRDKRTTASVAKDGEGNYKLVLAPFRFAFDGLQGTLHSEFTFLKDGKIQLRRAISDLSDKNKKVTVKEEFRGCYGTTQYPENMNGIVLKAANSEKTEDLTYEYRSRELKTANPKIVEADIPQLGISVALEAGETASSAKAEEGHLFHPYYQMEVQGEIGEGEELLTCLIIKKL